MAALSMCFGAAAQSPHSGYFLENIPNRHELNPSLTPDFNYASFLGLPLGGMMTIGLNSNVGAETFLFSRNDELVTGLHESVSSEEFLGKLKKNNYLEANLRLNILSFGFKKWGGFNTFNLNVRSTTGFNLPRELFEFAKIGQEDGAPASYDLSSIGVSTTNYVEFAFGHSRQITDKLRAGAKFKYLAGVAAADFSLDRMDVNMSGDRWSIRESGQLFTTNVVDIMYNQNGEIDDFELDAGRLGVAGNGIGFDFGASYQLLDNLTLSASLTDIGFITWKGSTATANPDEFIFDGFHHIGAEDNPETGESALDQEMDQLEDDLKALARFKNEEDSRRTQSLTTTLNIGGEYSVLNRKISFGLLSSTRMTSPKVWTELMASVNFRPASWFHATLNGSVSNLGQSVGVLLNFCPKGFNFFIGSDYIPLKYSKQGIPVSTAKLNFVMGLTFTFKHG